MRSILLRTFLMVAMGSTSFRRPRPSPVGPLGFVSRDGGPWALWGLRQRRVLVGRRTAREWPGSRSGLPAGRPGPEPRTTSTIMVSPGSRPACVTVVTHRLSDPRSSPRPSPRMPNEPDHLLLRRYHVAREQGQDEEAARIWQRLAENTFDRITQTCKAFRFTGGTGLPPDGDRQRRDRGLPARRRDGPELPRAGGRPVPRGGRTARSTTRASTTAARSCATQRRAAAASTSATSPTGRRARTTPPSPATRRSAAPTSRRRSRTRPAASGPRASRAGASPRCATTTTAPCSSSPTSSSSTPPRSPSGSASASTTCTSAAAAA